MCVAETRNGFDHVEGGYGGLAASNWRAWRLDSGRRADPGFGTSRCGVGGVDRRGFFERLALDGYWENHVVVLQSHVLVPMMFMSVVHLSCNFWR